MSATITKAARAARRVKTPDDAVSMVLFDNRTGVSIGLVNLTGKEFDLLQQRAAHFKTSLDQMLCEAVARMLTAEKLTAVMNVCVVSNTPMRGGAK